MKRSIWLVLLATFSACGSDLAVMVVDGRAAAGGDGSEYRPFQSLAQGFSAAAAVPAATLRIVSEAVRFASSEVRPIVTEVRVVGAPSTALLSVSVTVAAPGVLHLQYLTLQQEPDLAGPSVVCLGGALQFSAVKASGERNHCVEMVQGILIVMESAFVEINAPVFVIKRGGVDVTVKHTEFVDTGDLFVLEEKAMNSKSSALVQNSTMIRTGTLVNCRENLESQWSIRLESGIVDSPVRPLFTSKSVNISAEFISFTFTNSQEVISGSVISSTFSFANCTFQSSTTRLFDLSALLGRISLHNSSITDIGRGPLLLLPNNLYSPAVFSITSSFISNITNMNTTVAGGIINASGITVEIRDLEVWGNTIAEGGLFIIRSGLAVVENLYYHDSFTGIFSMYETVASVVSLTDVKAFKLTQAAGRFTSCLAQSQCLWTNVSITNSQGSNSAAPLPFILLWPGFSSTATVRRSDFHNTGRSFPCMGPSDSSRLDIYDSTFVELTNNAIFVVFSESQMNVHNLTLVRPNAAAVFTCSFSTKCVNASRVRIVGEANLSYISGSSGEVVISHSEFSDVKEALFVAIGGSLTVLEVEVTGLTKPVCKGCIDTNISFTAFTLKDAAALVGLQAAYCTVAFLDLRLVNVTINNFLSLDFSTLYLTGAALMDVKVNSFGGLLSATDSKIVLRNVDLEDCVGFLSIRVGLMHLSNCDVQVIGSRFQRFDSTLIYAFESTVELRNSSFRAGGSSSKVVPTFGSVLWGEHCPQVSISQCSFHLLSADSGGALFLVGGGTEVCAITNCTASDNRATEKGGFVYISGVQTVLRNITVLANTATHGGAVWAEGESRLTAVDCVFANNSAAMEGGAVRAFSSQFHSFGTLWEFNSAEYGPDWASGARFVAVLEGESLQPLYNFSIGVASGQTHTQRILIGCFDDYGQIVSTELSSKLALSVAEANASLNIPVLLEAKNGIFTIPSLTVIGQPKSKLKAVAALGSTATQEVFTIMIRECLAGEYFINSQCLLCTHNTYSFSPEQPCTLCPSTADCPQGAVLSLHRGYWRVSNMTSDILACDIPELCLGGVDSQCAEGHSGVMCAHCNAGYFKANQQQCVSCGSSAFYYLKTALAFVLSVGSFGVSLFFGEDMQMTHIVVLDYLQSLRILENFTLFWPKEVAHFYSVLGDIGSLGLTALTSECLSPLPEVTSAYSQLIVGVLYCTAIAATALFFVSIRRFFPASCRRQLRAAGVLFVCMLLPCLYARSLQLFSCISVGGKDYLASDPAQECWNREHWSYLLCIAVPVLVLTLLATASLLVVSTLFKLQTLCCIAIFLLRKVAVATLLVCSSRWRLCTQVSIVIFVNIATEALIYKIIQCRSKCFVSLYQSMLNATTVLSFMCAIYSAADMHEGNREELFIALNYICFCLPIGYSVCCFLQRRRLKVQPVSSESHLEEKPQCSFQSSEAALQVPHTSLASADVAVLNQLLG